MASEAEELAKIKAESDKLRSEIEALKKAPGMKDLVAMRAEIDRLKEENSKLEEFRVAQDTKYRHDVLVEMKEAGVDVAPFEEFTLEQLRTVALAIKSVKIVDSGAKATKPGELPAKGLAAFVAGQPKKEGYSKEELSKLRALEKDVLRGRNVPT